MKTVLTTKNVRMSKDTRERIEDRFETMGQKWPGKVNELRIVIDRQGESVQCRVMLMGPQWKNEEIRIEGDTTYTAVESAVHKLSTLLGKRHDRDKGRKKVEKISNFNMRRKVSFDYSGSIDAADLLRFEQSRQRLWAS